jgi:hypothetical protein
MIIKLDNTVLAGDDRDGPIDIRGNFGIALQEAPHLRAASQDNYDRKNRKTVITFTRSHLFEDLADAQVFYLEHAEETLARGLVTITAKSPTKEVERYLKDAVVHACNPRLLGVTVLLDYTITGGKILKERPS